MIIAIDFDGTIVEDEYPGIGPAKIFAFDTMKEMVKHRHQLILWTPREGKLLDEAVEYCRENGLEFYAINRSYPEEKFDPKDASRKIICDLFVSDKNFGGMKGWGELWQEIKSDNEEQKAYRLPEDKGLLSKLKELFFGR